MSASPNTLEKRGINDIRRTGIGVRASLKRVAGLTMLRPGGYAIGSRQTFSESPEKQGVGMKHPVPEYN